MKKNKQLFLILTSCLLMTFLGCNTFTSDSSKKLEKLNKELIELNNTYRSKKIALQNPSLLNDLFRNELDNDYSVLVYYDADCWVCFEELSAWQEIINHFKKIDSKINIKFILSTNDLEKTKKNLGKINFSESYIVIDTDNSFLKHYKHVSYKPYNTMLLDKNKKILFIGSPLKSKNLKKYYSELILN
jgi:peroxiredoxin